MNKKQKLVLKGMLCLQWLAVALPVALLIYNFNVKNILFSLFSLVLSHVIYRFRCDFHHRIQIKHIEKSYSELNRRNRRAVIRKIKSAK